MFAERIATQIFQLIHLCPLKIQYGLHNQRLQLLFAGGLFHSMMNPLLSQNVRQRLKY